MFLFPSSLHLFSIIKMAAIRHLGFSKFRTICEKLQVVPISTSMCKIWRRSDDLQLSYCVFSTFKMVAVRHLGFGIRHIGPPTTCVWWS